MLFGAILAGYVLGALPFGYLAGRLRGINIMEIGSGNIGATNVLRTLGPVWAVVVLLLDAGKGALSAYLGWHLFSAYPHWGAVAGGGAALMGHTWSLFLGLRGGKGAATGAGVALFLVPEVTVIALVIFILTIALTRYVSLGSLMGAVSAMIGVLIMPTASAYQILILIGGTLIIYRHRSNIRRLLAGTESRLGERDVR